MFIRGAIATYPGEGKGEGGRGGAEEQRKEGGKRGPRAISIGSSGLSTHVWCCCVSVQVCVFACAHMCCTTTTVSFMRTVCKMVTKEK